MIYYISHAFIKFFSRFFFPCTFYGQENIPRRGGFIFASNHASNVDPFVIGISLQRRINYLAKESLFSNKMAAFFFHQVGAMPLKRDTSDFRAIRDTLRCLSKGRPVVLFPEGTRGAGGRLKKVQAGVGLIAVKSKVPVVPVYIQDSDKALPPKAKWFTRHPVTVMIGQPLTFDEKRSYQSIAEDIMTAIFDLQSRIKTPSQ